MSHHEQHFLKVPKALHFKGKTAVTLREVKLIVKGQGTVSFSLSEQREIDILLENPVKAEQNGIEKIKVSIGKQGVIFSELINDSWKITKVAEGEAIGLDIDPDYHYWLSLDYHNRFIRYGKGEMRLGTKLAEYQFKKAENAEAQDPYAWLKEVDAFKFSTETFEPQSVWRDPVTVEPPLLVKPMDEVTMDEVASNAVTVPQNLSAACQMLYANVAGKNFQLNTPDFPDFSEAIEASIKDENGFCYQILKEKAIQHLIDRGGNPDTEEPNEDDVRETYLRITMGVNQGESPGIPFVMEIWPPQHRSPIHHHGEANALIRVLHGEIKTHLFPMLSTYHKEPFRSAVLQKGDVTWISPAFNQFHQLINPNAYGPTCITIQCYNYGQDNTEHYEYFNFIENGSIVHFTPNSDCDFLEFKKIIKKEWEERNKPKPQEK
jgi:hypothetical protein